MTEQDLVDLKTRADTTWQLMSAVTGDTEPPTIHRDVMTLIAEVERLRAKSERQMDMSRVAAHLREDIGRLQERLRQTIADREADIRHATLAATERAEAAERENAKMREMVQQVAGVPDDDYDEACVFCHEMPGYSKIVHTPDCLVMKARQLLAEKEGEAK